MPSYKHFLWLEIFHLSLLPFENFLVSLYTQLDLLKLQGKFQQVGGAAGVVDGATGATAVPVPASDTMRKLPHLERNSSVGPCGTLKPRLSLLLF